MNPKKFVKEDGMNLRFISPLTDKYFQLCVFAISDDPYALQFIPSTTKDYHLLCLKAVQTDGCVLEFVDHLTPEYESICVEAVKNRWRALEYVNKKWTDVSRQVEKPLNIFNFRGRTVKTSQTELIAVPQVKRLSEICLLAVQKCGWALRYVPVWLSNYEEICLEACKKDGDALLYVPTYLDTYTDICVVAIKQNKDAYEYVHESRQNIVTLKSLIYNA